MKTLEAPAAHIGSASRTGRSRRSHRSNLEQNAAGKLFDEPLLSEEVIDA
jgi:hypothetical protein